MTAYIALLQKNPDGYTVTFPDFPDCLASGPTPEEARKNATETLKLHADELKFLAIPLPSPTNLEKVFSVPETDQSLAFVVILPQADPAIRVNVTLPRSLLAAIGKRRNRSAFLAQAAREKLAREAHFRHLTTGDAPPPALLHPQPCQQHGPVSS